MSIMSSLEPEDEPEGIYSSSQSSTQSKNREISDILAQAEFQCENSVLLPDLTITVEPMPAEVLAARIAASRLCHDMGDSFKNERKRSKVFDSCVVGLFEKWDKEHVLQPEKSRCFGKADRVILEDNVVIAIREGKWEAGHGGSDVYMQIARDYDLLVRVLVESTETAAIN